MIEVVFLLGLGLIWIIFATIQDLKNQEVANWLNFSLIIFALGFRFFYSLFLGEDYGFFYQGLIGFGIFFVLGNLFYYSRIFAGGDAKLMIALGAVLPIYESFYSNVKFFIIFFVVFLFSGMIYGMAFSAYLTLRHFTKFKKEFKNQFKKNKNIIYAIIFFSLFFIAIGFSERVFFLFGGFVFILPYLYLYTKSVDEACMIKKIKAKDLREGDWLYKDIRIGRKIIKANWDGLSKKDINLIQKKNKSILIRQGIPFVPVFLISFLIILFFLYYYNINFLRIFENFIR